jgi:putative chitinase
MITPQLLLEVMPRCPRQRAESFAPALTEAVARWDLSTPRRLCSLLAQIAVESLDLVALQENLTYTTPERLREIFRVFREERDPAPFVRNPEGLANLVYGDRGEGSTGRALGNGDEASGDGWRYRGRGPLHLTGRANYRDIGELIRRPLEHVPDFVLDPYVGSLAAAAFFRRAGCHIAADAGDIDGVTRKVNPAMIGKSERRAVFARACSAFGISP